MARRSVRPQAVLHHLHRDVHGVLVPVRHRDQPWPAHHLPAGAGLFRRRIAAQSAIHHPRHVPARQARRGVRRDGDRHCRGPRARSDAGRLYHRPGELALDLLSQHPGRRARGISGLDPGRGSAVGEKQEKPRRRLHRAVADNARARRAADHDGPRRGRGLVRIRLHLADGADCPARHPRRNRVAAGGQKADRRSQCVQGPQFRGRLHPDRRDGRDPLCERRHHSAIRPAEPFVHRDLGGPRAVARRRGGDRADPDRRQADDGSADPLCHRHRVHNHGPGAALFQHDHAGNRFRNAGEDAPGADRRSRVSLRPD